MAYGEIIEIAVRSLAISSTATFFSTAWSIPLALKLSSSNSKETKILMSIFNAMIGLPTVLVGLLLYLLLSKSGPLGALNLLYRPEAIILGEAILITPLIVSLAYEMFRKARENYWEVAYTLGADELQAGLVMLKETISSLIVIVLISFSRALGELGVALMVGGNIRGYTRVFTTTIALEISKGNFETAIILGLILLGIISTITIVVRVLGENKNDNS